MLNDNLLAVAAGVMPDTVAVFKFYRAGQELADYQTRWANKKMAPPLRAAPLFIQTSHWETVTANWLTPRSAVT